MKSQLFLYAVIGLLVGSLITAFFIANSVNTNNVGVMRMMGLRQGIGAPMNSNLDKHFIEQMIPHHEGAIEMAELAKKRSQRSEILTLADAIITSQSQEITQMQSWYKEWYGIDVPIDSSSRMGMGRGMMHGGMMGGENADIEYLENAEDFDTAFLQEMIPHHQMAVMMAQMLLSGTDRPEMKQLGQNIIKAQETEIEQMRLWLQS
ncbi:hypothetical protein A2Z33_06180 [Candidatus Gottesmanbacteria bacterium RBG_16_52_11]|uniref:DUF305 domain-containing protein n=1 Tax=Candidatus Gottesmanbacteria bacterium RBG_16_52_11 TaxID=1798374 RepID=A0A1F5YXF3_9BACT|nr:MAG: hypothetical protein A2Z33_06180 [Candidatus Gottesmanbacteria bacterium RBG_16_52_11]